MDSLAREESATPDPDRSGLTASLSRFANETCFESLPAEAVRRAKTAILDCVGCALAGAGTSAVAPVSQIVRHEGGAEEAVAIGLGYRAPATAAALVNGTSAHSLDFDDTNPPMIGHPSVPIVPALLALADRFGFSGRAILTAYVVGFDVEARLGRLMNPSHYAHGWHATSTLGGLAAAAAAAHLISLDEERFRRAIAIAASGASGLRRNFGTMVKPLHAGMAARGGVLAALLASNGFTADGEILDGERGFVRAFAGEATFPAEVESVRFDIGQPLEIIRSGIGIKRYPCCGCTHTALDAILDLRRRHEIKASDVERVECGVNPLAPDILIHHEVATPLEGKFSMEYCLAVALVDGAAGLDQFTPERVQDNAVQDLLKRVRMYVDPDCPIRQGVFPSKVTVHLRDGKAFTLQVNEAKGHPDHPLTPEDLADKFRSCALRAIGPAAADAALEHLLHLENLDDARDLTRLLMG